MDFIDQNGLEYTYASLKRWDSDDDYNELISNFQKMKSYFVDKGIGVIIGEVEVSAEENKDIEKILKKYWKGNMLILMNI